MQINLPKKKKKQQFQNQLTIQHCYNLIPNDTIAPSLGTYQLYLQVYHKK